MKRKITLKQIARELEVSISTVSKALKDSKEISKDTREKIQMAYGEVGACYFDMLFMVRC